MVIMEENADIKGHGEMEEDADDFYEDEME
jgi:hypothetical protein